MIILVLGFLIIIGVCFLTSQKIILTPQMCFALCFLPGIIYACFYVNAWDLHPSPLTLITMIGGTAFFAIISILLSKILKKRTISAIIIDGVNTDYLNHGFYKIRLSFIVLIAYTCIQLLTLLMLYRFLTSLTSGSLSEAIFYFRHARVFTNNTIEVPGFLGLLKYFVYSTGYITGYILIHSIVYKYWCYQPLLILNILLSVASDMLFGARTGTFQLLIAMAIEFYIIYGKKSGWKVKINKKILLIAGVAIIALIVGFKDIGNLLGRQSERENGEYLSVYIAAEIKNLDTFIREGNFGSDISTNQTLVNFINLIAAKTGHNEWYHKVDIPFRSINGHTLGNVYTIFYAFMYDGGLVGVLCFTGLMAIICQLVFNKAIQERDNSKIDIWVVIYSYLCCCLIFSFFSNTFYEQVFNYGFLKFIIFWIGLKLIFDKIRINIKFPKLKKIKFAK